VIGGLVVALLALVPHATWAQEARGTITGRVLDTSKSVVPGATVNITNVAMNTTVTLTTNEVGFFQAPYLIPGTYRITAELTGFKRHVRENVELRIGDVLDLDLTLDVGGATEAVTVTAETTLLETSSASLGQVVDSRRVSELPTPHGDPYALIGLANGVSYSRDPRLDRPFEPTHIVGFAIDGTRANRSDVTIDGVPMTATANAGEVISSYVPPQDLVAEFKVQTATFDASLGNTEGGVTNLSLKSGTNQLRGTAYFVRMPSGLFANDFFANANNVPLPEFTYNRYGGTLGGPVIFPGIYDGRSRTFFMYGAEGINEARPRNNGTPTVPTEKMRNGDFSELLALGPQYQIYNPFTRRAIAGGRIQADPFPGNIIPPSMFDPVAKKILDFIGRPKTPGNADGTSNFQNPSLTEEINYHTHTVRVDHVISDRQRLFARVNYYDRDSDYNNYFDNISTGEWFLFKSRSGAYDHVYTFNATTVMNLRYGYNRFIRGTNSNPGNRGMDLTSLGFPQRLNDMIPEDIRRFPRINMTGYQGTAVGGEFRPNDTHAFVGTLNKATGGHAIKGGLEFRSYRETDKFFANNQTAQFDFDANWTRGPLDNSTVAPGSLGQSVAAFLLGLPTTGSITRAADYAEQSTTWGFFVQDDWRVNRRLTLNLGLRYELEGALTERHDKSVRGFDESFIQPMEAAARAAYARNPTPEVPVAEFNVRGGLLFSNVDGQPRGLYEVPKNNWMPRAGFAFKLTEASVIRGGYGVFYGFLGQRRGDVIQSGFSSTTQLVPTLDNGLTFIETLSNPFLNGVQEPVGAAMRQQTFLGQSITFFNPNPKSPRMQRWQVGMQRELPGGFMGEATYVGNYGDDIEITRNINVLPNEYLSTSAVRDQARIDYLSQNVPNPFFGLMPSTAIAALRGATIPRERLLRPYPQFDAVNTTTNEGRSWYHSLQLRLDKRFSKGYTVGANYTYSRYEQATELLNGGDLEPTKVISDLDTPHRLSVSGIWELPFGPGRPIGASAPAAVGMIIGGWQITGIYTYQTGRPVGNWGNLLYTGSYDDIALDGDQTLEKWFNTDAGFNKVTAQQLGSNVRTFPMRFDSVRLDPINNVDLSLIKNTRISAATLQIRMESLNAFNHPQFPGPNLTPTQVAFGTISASQQVNYARRTQIMVKVLW
jgi:hypothetical protein